MHARNRGAVWLALTLPWITPGSAQAFCPSDPPRLVWSYPADGATDVPTNLVIWLVGANGVPAITLDGAPLTSLTRETAGALRVDAPELEPESDHVLEVHVPDLRDGAPANAFESFRIAFRTGLDGALVPAAPGVYGRRRGGGIESSLCPDVVRAQGCFDGEQDSLLVFDTTSETAIAWLVQATSPNESAVWPATCGAPAVLTAPARMDQCHTLRAIGPGGLASEPISLCSDQATEAPPDALHRRTEPMCVLSPGTSRGPGHGLWLLVLGFAAVWRRRRFYL